MWKRSPGLPLLTLALLVTQSVLSVAARDHAVLIIGIIAVGLVALGFGGTQRIWYLRGFRRDRLAADEIGPLTFAFLGRFIVLGLLVMLVLVPVSAVARGVLDTTGIVITSVVLGLIMDFALTFVTPALTFTTRSATEALGSGVRMIRKTWPASTYYVLAPGLLATTLSWVWPGTDAGLIVAQSFCVVSGMLALLFKGAVVAFFLRLHTDVGSQGAAYAERFPGETAWRPGADPFDDDFDMPPRRGGAAGWARGEGKRRNADPDDWR